MVGPETYPGQATPEALAAAYAEHAIRAGSWDRWLLTLHATIGNRIRRNEAAAYVARREEAQ
jgi:truncated hemoglobin YjbI